MARLRLRRFFKSDKAIRKPFRIFVNRNLRLDAARLVGFDMDYTLAVYRKEVIERVAFQKTIEKLIGRKGYSPAIQELVYDPQAMVRGLVLDRKLGNVLKIDQFGYVCKVYHGRTRVSDDERIQTYAHSRIRLNNDRFHSVDTLFGLPEAHLFAELVHDMDGRAANGRSDYWRLWDDVRECLDLSHQDDSIKADVIRNPGRYLVKDKALAPTLDKFRAAGKRLFLLTNSSWGYTDRLMGYLLNGELEEYPSWLDYFDRVIVEAAKPGFFSCSDPFEGLDGQPMDPLNLPEAARVLRRGNCRLFERMEGARGPEVLFVGDHIYGDILRSKQSSGWRTAMIIEELEGELEASLRGSTVMGRLRDREVLGNQLDFERSVCQRRIDRLSGEPRGAVPGWLRRLAGEAAGRYRKRLEAKLAALDRRIRENDQTTEALKREYDRLFNLRWGPLFRDGNEVSRFGQQVQRFACLYTGRVSNFISYPTNKYFQSPIELMPHDLSV
jgi:HAD superfamily 5'-nucleotidase-like hydrolase